MHKKCEEILKELENEDKLKVWWSFKFPEKEELKLRLKDVLEDTVEDKYYLSDKMIEGFQQHNKNHIEKGTGFIWKTRDTDGIASALRANAALCPTDNTINVGEVTPNSQAGQVYSDEGISPTLIAGTHGYAMGNILEKDKNSPKCVRVGGMFDTEDSKHQAGSVYDKEGIAPPLDTMQGGYRQPMVTIDNPLKGKSKYGWHFEQNVYSEDSQCCRSIKAGGGSGNIPKVITSNIKSEEPRIINVGNYSPSNHHASRIVDEKGIAPTLTQQEEKILVKNATKKGYDEAVEGDSINLAYPESKTRRGRVGHQVSQTIQCNDMMGVVEKTRKDIKQEEKYCEYCGKKLKRKRFNGRLEDFTVFKNRKYCNRECMKRAYLKIGEYGQNWSNAHTTARKINELILHKAVCELCGSDINLDIHHIDGNWQNNNLDNLMCLCRSCHTKYEKNKNNEDSDLRIRKLTPRETWRLMGFDDEDFNQAQSVGISNSQLYKQARK